MRKGVATKGRNAIAEGLERPTSYSCMAHMIAALDSSFSPPGTAHPPVNVGHSRMMYLMEE